MKDGRTRRVATQPTGAQDFLTKHVVSIVFASGRMAGSEVMVGPEGASMGRGNEADIVIQDASVSSLHAALEPCSTGFRLRDLGSTNGCKVNGAKHLLPTGSHVAFCWPGTASMRHGTWSSAARLWVGATLALLTWGWFAPPVVHSGSLFRRSVLERLGGYDETMRVGSDADLLPGSATEDLTIRAADGRQHTQSWYYPSRQDCLTCHNAETTSTNPPNPPAFKVSHALAGNSGNCPYTTLPPACTTCARRTSAASRSTPSRAPARCTSSPPSTTSGRARPRRPCSR